MHSPNTPEADMDAFLEAHRAFHGRDRFTQYEHSAASVITKHREAATAELREQLKAATDWIDNQVGEVEPVGGPDDPCGVNIGRAIVEAARAIL